MAPGSTPWPAPLGGCEESEESSHVARVELPEGLEAASYVPLNDGTIGRCERRRRENITEESWEIFGNMGICVYIYILWIMVLRSDKISQ